ncbi:putative lipoprotein [Campylobacter jejuni subsp. jejuni HN-CJD07035]|nr:lipoprotein, putative [Campylobacter jejuni subsp. jejuni 260.94]ENI12251.1 putative lipoprotein [Campylobacter jejuni subsp. jejuni ICDCCJ07002]ENI12633.1 putative lipoprotein [Campylobacter jejuni subsp. jejuni ICDCCJ07004]EPS03290.1 putative lipoprotein [Campylobacter jejuni subsp. jejuni HN-CJD07035]
MSKFALILSFFIALFMSACTNATFIQSFIQTSNEGIFIRSQKQQSFKISFQNPS